MSNTIQKTAQGAIDLNSVRISTMETQIREMRSLVLSQGEELSSIHQMLGGLSEAIDSLHLLLVMLGVTQEEVKQAKENMTQIYAYQDYEEGEAAEDENGEDGDDDSLPPPEIASFPVPQTLARRGEPTLPILRLAAAIEAIETLIRKHLDLTEEEIQEAVKEAVGAMQQAAEPEPETEESK